MKSSKFFRRLGLLLVLLFLFMLALTVIYPFLWMIISSFKDNTELYLSPWSLPGEWRWGNFASAWNAGIGNYFLNSLFVTSVSTVFSILFLFLMMPLVFWFDPELVSWMPTSVIALVCAFFIGAPWLLWHLVMGGRLEKWLARFSRRFSPRVQEAISWLTGIFSRPCSC